MPTPISTPGSGLVFNNTYNFNTTTNAACVQCIVAAEQTLESLFTNAITINVTFDEAAAGITGFGATNQAGGGFSVNYQTLMSHLPSADGLLAIDPTGGHSFNLAESYARMLGLDTAPALAVDDTVTLNTSYNWAFGQDVTNIMIHELSEGAMGRIGGLGDQGTGGAGQPALGTGQWDVMDLFRFNAAGQHDVSDGRDGQTTYFSTNGTHLSPFPFYNEQGNPTNTDDVADFNTPNSLGGVDPFGSNFVGETDTITATDIAIMQALGWNTKVTVPPHTDPTVAVQNVSVPVNQSVALVPDLTLSNPSGDNITHYWVEDLGGAGHVTVGGAIEPVGKWIETTASWANLQFSSDAAAGTHTLDFAVTDGTTGAFIQSPDLTVTVSNPVPPPPVGITAATIEADYAGIVRGTLDSATATMVVGEINNGFLTETNYVDSLLGQTANTSVVAVAVEASMYGVTGSTGEVTALTNLFLPPQIANAQLHGYNPQVYAAEAVGLAFAFGGEQGSTTFEANFGSHNPATLTDSSFASAAASTIFGSASTPAIVNAIAGYVANWEAFYTQNHLFGSAVVDAARGAAWGDAVGLALANNLGPLLDQAHNFLEDAAQGTAQYGVSLVGQAAHHQFM